MSSRKHYPVGNFAPGGRPQAQAPFVGYTHKSPEPTWRPIRHPFQVVRGPTGDGYVEVCDDSLLLEPLAAANEANYTISNLADEFAVSAGDFIYLKCTVSALAVTAAQIIKTTEQNLLTFSGADQTYFHVPIAEIRTYTGTEETVGVQVSSTLWTHQRTFTHLRVVAFCVAGKSAIYALPV